MFNYTVLGAGRQGTAAAYDLARFGEAGRIVIADREQAVAAEAAARVNRLSGHEVAVAATVDARDRAALTDLLRGTQATISALPFAFNLTATEAAIAAGSHIADLGGNTAVVQQQLALHPSAKLAGISVLPDCGLMPGMGNLLALHALSLLANPSEVYIYVGGLPLHPRPPLNYQLSFNMDGLINEYVGDAIYLRGGEIASVPALTEPEWVEFPAPLGRCEAFVTSGGTSTVPYHFAGRLRVYEEKTVRYPGHLSILQAWQALGLFDAEPQMIGGQLLSPRRVLADLLSPHISFPGAADVVVLRVRVRNDAGQEAQVDLLDQADAASGFSAMERTTGFPTALLATMQAQGLIAPGAQPLEVAVPVAEFVSRLGLRQFSEQRLG